MEGEEAAVQFAALVFEHAYFHFDASLLQLTDASTLHLSKLVDTAHHHASHTFLDNKVGTGGRLAVVRAGFQAHIDGSLRQQGLILRLHGSKGVHLGMSLATAHMIALADNPSVGTHNHCPHHRVRLRILLSVPGQLNTASHIFLVVCHHSIRFPPQKYLNYLI